MNYLIPILIIVLFCGLIAWRWIVGINYMQKNHPDYKGEDFLDWGESKEENENDKNQIM